MTPKGGAGMAVVMETYLAGIGELADPAALARLRVGARLDLRRRRRVEVRAPDGRPLGYLPPGEAQAVAALMEAGAPAVARVTAVVPAFRRWPRVHLRVSVYGP
jgi:hypothetical protein